MKRSVSLIIVAILWMFFVILPVGGAEIDDLVFYLKHSSLKNMKVMPIIETWKLGN